MKRLNTIFDILGLAFWLFLAGVRLAQAWQLRSFIAILLAIYATLVVLLLVDRRTDVAETPVYQKVIAWVSALLPLALDVRLGSRRDGSPGDIADDMEHDQPGKSLWCSPG